MKNPHYITLSLAALIWVSCATTPKTRIDKYPERFSSLPPNEQALVEQGQIKRGMSQHAVFLALGKPDTITYGGTSKGEYEQWNYYQMTPAYNTRFRGLWGGGVGWGRRGLAGGGWGGLGGWGIEPSVTYIPRQSTRVRFTNEIVDEFQARGNSLYR